MENRPLYGAELVAHRIKELGIDVIGRWEICGNVNAICDYLKEMGVYTDFIRDKLMDLHYSAKESR